MLDVAMTVELSAEGMQVGVHTEKRGEGGAMLDLAD